MTIDILMAKSLNGMLQPVDEMGREVMAKVGKRPVLVSIKKPRNIGHHRKLFVLLQLILENQERYKSIEELLSAVKVMTGHCTLLFLPDGTEVRVPKSIAFHALDQIAFEEFWKQVVKLTCEVFLPGVDSEDLERQILDLVGDNMAAAR